MRDNDCVTLLVLFEQVLGLDWSELTGINRATIMVVF